MKKISLALIAIIATSPYTEASVFSFAKRLIGKRLGRAVVVTGVLTGCGVGFAANHAKKERTAKNDAGMIKEDAIYTQPDVITLKAPNIDFRNHYTIGNSPFHVTANDETIRLVFHSNSGTSTVTKHHSLIDGILRDCVSIQSSNELGNRSIHATSTGTITMNFKTLNFFGRLKERVYRTFGKPGKITVITKS